MIERLIFLRTHKEEAKRIKSKKSFIMHAIYILLDLLWNFLEVRTQFDCPSQSNPAILYGTIFFFFFRELSFGGITTSWCQPTKSLCHEVFKQYSNITTLQKPSMQFTATELQFMSKKFFSCHLILLLGSTISQLRVVGFLTRLM